MDNDARRETISKKEEGENIKKLSGYADTDEAGNSAEDTEKGGMMSLSGHLKELRNRILVCVAVFVVTMLIGLSHSSEVVEILLSLGDAAGYEYVYLAPEELMVAYLFVAFIFGICLTLPLILYEIWAFIRPGLVKNENRLLIIALIFGLVCFSVGVLFAYAVMLPFMLRFLASLGAGTRIMAYISLQNYISFLMTVMLIFGIIFELPVIAVTLNWMGILKASWMKTARRVVIVGIFVLAAIVTPPDAVSQIMVAVPMIVLYELSILLCSLIEKSRRKKTSL